MSTPLFVDTGEQIRVLCPAHRDQLYPTHSAVPVTESEQRQAKLYWPAGIVCEECE